VEWNHDSTYLNEKVSGAKIRGVSGLILSETEEKFIFIQLNFIFHLNVI